MLMGMKYMAFSLTYDSLTEFDAFIAVCAACIRAVRVLARDGGSKLIIGFPDNWGAFGSRLCRSTKTVRSLTSAVIATTEHDAEKETCYAATKADLEGSMPPMPEIKNSQVALVQPVTIASHGIGAPMDWSDVGMGKIPA